MLTTIRKRTRKKTVRARSWLKLSQAEIEGCRFRTCAEASRNIAKGGLSARRNDLRRCRSANDGCAEEDHVGRIRFGRGGLCGRLLFGGERFAR